MALKVLIQVRYNAEYLKSTIFDIRAIFHIFIYISVGISSIPPAYNAIYSQRPFQNNIVIITHGVDLKIIYINSILYLVSPVVGYKVIIDISLYLRLLQLRLKNFDLIIVLYN